MLQAGFSIITGQGRIVFGILLLVILSLILLGCVLRLLFGSRLTSSDALVLGLAGWLLPASLASLLWLLFGYWIALAFLLLPSLMILFSLRFQADPSTSSGQRPQPASPKIIFLPLIVLLIAIPLRLAFVSKAILPSYFDSAQHYLLIKNILSHHAPLSTSYYHLGFHILAAFIISVGKLNIAQTMLILGQLILALMPAAVFFLIRYATGSNVAGFFAIGLAAFGWYMPAHAMDWGKYPALSSLGLIPFGLSLAYLIQQTASGLASRKRWAAYLLLGVSLLISELLHSRSLIVYVIVLLTWLIATWTQRLSPVFKLVLFAIVLAVVVWQVLDIQKEPVMTPLFDPYLHKGLWVTVLVLALTVFAWREHSHLVMACFLTISFMLGCLSIPVFVPGFGNLTLLDRPFVEMILYLPLTLLGGLGLAGAEKYIRHMPVRWGAVIVLIGLMSFHALKIYDWYPSDCCVIAGNDDVTAIHWMDEHLPPDAHIGISATILKVLASDSFEGYAGGDAGIWITPSINRVTFPLIFNTDFDQQSVLDMICKTGITHLYVGELGQTFDNAQLSKHPEWYEMLLSMPKVKVYKVTGCG